MNPRISVCIAVYNGADSLGRAIQSVQAQSFSPHEIFVIDDGSNDDSFGVASGLGCRVIRQENHGLGATRARLVSEAEGDWIALLDHDDWWEPVKLERQVEMIQRHGPGLYHTSGWFHYDGGETELRIVDLPEGSDSFHHILPENKIIESSALLPKQAILDVGNFTSETWAAVGWYVWLKLAPRLDFYSLNEPLVHYTIREGSIANNKYKLQSAKKHVLEKLIAPEFDALISKYSPTRQSELRALVKSGIGVAASSMARELDREGKRKEASELHKEGLRLAPTVPRVWSRYIRHLLGQK